MQQTTFRQFIQNEFDSLKTKNPAFSLRAFARRLGVNPAVLSEILSGKRRVSVKYAEAILDKLGTDPEQKSKVLAPETELNTTKIPRAKTATPVQQLILEADQYFLVAEPLYYSILCLLETVDAKSDENWIADRLKSRPQKVKRALERLKRLGLISETKEGHLKPIEKSLNTKDDIAHNSLKKRHEENLRAAIESLYEDDVLDREFSFLTMAINPAQLPLAKKMIREFRYQLAEVLEQGDQREVYELSIQLFPRTRLKGDKK